MWPTCSENIETFRSRGSWDPCCVGQLTRCLRIDYFRLGVAHDVDQVIFEGGAVAIGAYQWLFDISRATHWFANTAVRAG
jgi:hypothetical protein